VLGAHGTHYVIPAQAGIHGWRGAGGEEDTRLRGNDVVVRGRVVGEGWRLVPHGGPPVHTSSGFCLPASV
jgi:hypothetical protein